MCAACVLMLLMPLVLVVLVALQVVLVALLVVLVALPALLVVLVALLLVVQMAEVVCVRRVGRRGVVLVTRIRVIPLSVNTCISDRTTDTAKSLRFTTLHHPFSADFTFRTHSCSAGCRGTAG